MRSAAEFYSLKIVERVNVHRMTAFSGRGEMSASGRELPLAIGKSRPTAVVARLDWVSRKRAFNVGNDRASARGA